LVGGFGFLFFVFLFFAWLVLLFLRSLSLARFPPCSGRLPRLVSAVRVPLFLPLPSGSGSALRFLLRSLFRAVVSVVCALLRGLRFLPLPSSARLRSALVGPRSLVALSLSFVRWLPLVALSGSLFLLVPALPACFPPPPPRVASRGLVRVRGLRLLLLLGWAFLCLFGFLLGCFLLVAGALFLWAVASFIAPNFVTFNFSDMAYVQNFVGGAYASRKIALQWLAIIQPVHTEKLRVHRVKIDNSFLYFIVF
jgi:hypothetical protein